jgi:hypothetical protein
MNDIFLVPLVSILVSFILFLLFRIRSVQQNLDKTLKLRNEERIGRTRSEQNLRELNKEHEILKAETGLTKHNESKEGKVWLFIFLFYSHLLDFGFSVYWNTQILL